LFQAFYGWTFLKPLINWDYGVFLVQISANDHCHFLTGAIPTCFNLPFFGKRWINGLKAVSIHTFFVERQYGQLLPLFLLPIIAFHSWFLSLLHSHHALLPEFGVTSLELNLPFFVGCHSLARNGLMIWRQLSRHTFLPEQYGQPVLLFLLEITATQLCPFEHNHQTFLWEFGVTSLGVKVSFLVGCHSLAKSGQSFCKL